MYSNHVDTSSSSNSNLGVAATAAVTVTATAIATIEKLIKYDGIIFNPKKK